MFARLVQVTLGRDPNFVPETSAELRFILDPKYELPPRTLTMMPLTTEQSPLATMARATPVTMAQSPPVTTAVFHTHLDQRVYICQNGESKVISDHKNGRLKPLSSCWGPNPSQGTAMPTF